MRGRKTDTTDGPFAETREQLGGFYMIDARAVALAMRDGPEAGLALIHELLERGGFEDYHLAHAAHADLSRRRGRRGQAAASYARALSVVTLEPERRALQRRLTEVNTV